MKKIFGLIPHGMAIFMAVIFLDSLRFKFTDAPETQEIFGRLDAWAGSLGAPGLFGHTGLFSQYSIGAAEAVASACLIAGILPALRRLQAAGAALGVAIMSGAISFHTLTPLGTDPNQDGGGLFIAACVNWLFGAALLLAFRRKEAVGLGVDLLQAFLKRA